MSVPAQVRKQSEAVQQLYDDLNADETPASPEKGEAEAIGAVEPADSGSEVVAEPAPDAGEQEETFAQKYRTLQGMYNADVPRLTAENQELGRRVSQMEDLISTMQAAPTVAEVVTEPKPLLTTEEVDEYGDSIDIMRKVSQEVAGGYQRQIEELQATVQQLQGTVIPRVEQLSNQQAQSAEQSFWAELSRLAPNWREINDTEGFKSWLLEVDPLSGVSRQGYLEDAQRQVDAQRVAGFFQAWQQANGTVPVKADGPANKSELEKQVAPGRGRSSGVPQGAETKTYTPKDIAEFYTAVRTGKFKGKEKERDIIERDIFASQQEGRIVHA